MQVPASQSASSLLLSTRPPHRFSSGCDTLDALVTPRTFSSTAYAAPQGPAEQGLARGAVLELLGPPGIGKTRAQLGFVLAERFKKGGGEVLVIDADGALLPSLISDTAALYAQHNGYHDSDVQAVLEGVRYRRVDSAWLLIAFFRTLESWLEAHPKVNLVIVDSLSAHLRPTLDSATRTLIAETVRNALSVVCASGTVSVILSTHLSLKLFGPDQRPSSWSRDAEALLVPQIAERWIPQDVNAWRVLLYYDERGERLASTLSSPEPTVATRASFAMDALGPCDVPEAPPLENGSSPS
ncbi:hypothetical protein JCM8208_000079 [Rhodotorula glutinis]